MYRVVELRKYKCDVCGELIQSISKNIEKDEDRFDFSDKDFGINIFNLETKIGVRQDDECLTENIDLCPLCAYKLLDSLGNIGEGERLKKYKERAYNSAIYINGAWTKVKEVISKKGEVNNEG